MPFFTPASMRKTIAGMYQPYRLHPELFTDKFNEKWLHQDFLDIHKDFQKADPDKIHPGSAVKLSPKLKVEIPNVYSFQVFQPAFVKMFHDEIQNFYSASDKHDIPFRAPNGMNSYGVVVNEIGLRPLMTHFQQEYLWPITRILFPKEASQFDDHHAFIVRYQAGEDRGLDMHIDDSDVTFNVCLGEEFTGSTLTFCGMFGAPDHRKKAHLYKHEIGKAVLHLGSHRHGADDIESGKRSNLIVWNHNHAWRRSREYKQQRTFQGYQREEGPPDEACLSYTHDRDYAAYKEIPKDVHIDPNMFKAWCPPRGYEYDGFDDAMRQGIKKRKVNREEEK